VGSPGTVGQYLAANTTYDCAVTSVAPDGTETTAGATASAVEGATAYPVGLIWTSPGNTVTFNIYKATSGGALGLLTSVSGGPRATPTPATAAQDSRRHPAPTRRGNSMRRDWC
jgi:hypothetical protein